MPLAAPEKRSVPGEMELGWQGRGEHGPCCSADHWWGWELSWGRSELLLLATMAKVWGWTDLPAGSGLPRISPFWLLIPLPNHTPPAPAAPGDGEQWVPKVGGGPRSVWLRGGSCPVDCLLSHCYQSNSPAAGILFLCWCCLALREREERETQETAATEAESSPGGSEEPLTPLRGTKTEIQKGLCTGLRWRQPGQVVSVPAYGTAPAPPARCASISPSPSPLRRALGCKETWGSPGWGEEAAVSQHRCFWHREALGRATEGDVLYPGPSCWSFVQRGGARVAMGIEQHAAVAWALASTLSQSSPPHHPEMPGGLFPHPACTTGPLSHGHKWKL